MLEKIFWKKILGKKFWKKNVEKKYFKTIILKTKIYKIISKCDTIFALLAPLDRNREKHRVIAFTGAIQELLLPRE